ncbi:MAG TPA: MBL fold metallo-hydrolase [Solirubrobacteraceae bacterium]|jgi:glyoxylase-like metal-dependent hydrolase (beta-lactamase superfamily II)
MPRFICATCAAQFPDSDQPPEHCPICTDERQYLPEGGQQWTTLDELAATHHNVVREDAELTGVSTEPWLAIGQRALLVPCDGGLVMWDCVTYFDDDAAAEIERRGGLKAIAISHPHYYSGMADWAARFDCPVVLHAADERWITRPDPAIELWEDEAKTLGDGVTLIHCGGHFAGGTVLHWAAGNALLTGDIVQVIPDRTHVGFMYSYPNIIPLSESAVARIAQALEPYDYDVIYGAWWDRLVRRDAKGIVRRSAERYGRALRGELAP